MIRRYRWKGNFTESSLKNHVPAGVTPTILGTSAVLTDIELLPDPVSVPAQEDLDEYLAALGWTFVEVDPTTPLDPTQILFAPEFNNDEGDYSVHYVAAGGTTYFSFRIPWDFVTLNKLVHLGFPNSTSNTGDMDMSSDYGKVGEPFNAHSESNPGVPFSGTAGEFIEVDISSVFSSLEPGDACGMFLNQNGISGGMNYLGVLLEYSNS